MSPKYINSVTSIAKDVGVSWREAKSISMGALQNVQAIKSIKKKAKHRLFYVLGEFPNMTIIRTTFVPVYETVTPFKAGNNGGYPLNIMSFEFVLFSVIEKKMGKFIRRIRV